MKNILLTLITCAFAVVADAQDLWTTLQQQDAVPKEQRSVTPALRLDGFLERTRKNLENLSFDNQRKLNPADIQLIFDGDSITDGWRGNGKSVWLERYEQLGAVDYGHSGDETQHVLWRLAQGQAKGLHPKLIILLIGTNNLGNSGMTPAETADGVKAVVTKYREVCLDARLLLLAIFPRGKSADDPYRVKIREVNAAIKPLADGDKIIWLDFGEKLLNPDNTANNDLLPDNLHLSTKGYQLWAAELQPYIDRYVK